MTPLLGFQDAACPHIRQPVPKPMELVKLPKPRLCPRGQRLQWMNPKMLPHKKQCTLLSIGPPRGLKCVKQGHGCPEAHRLSRNFLTVGPHTAREQVTQIPQSLEQSTQASRGVDPWPVLSRHPTMGAYSAKNPGLRHIDYYHQDPSVTPLLCPPLSSNTTPHPFR